MSDTPRTDAQLANTGKFNACWPNVDADFAETLERELNQAIKERDRFKECDEAVGALHRLMSDAGIECGHIVDRVERVVIQRDKNKAGWDTCRLVALRLERERNEARECLREAMKWILDNPYVHGLKKRWRKAAGLEKT